LTSSCFERDRLRRWKGLRTFLWSKCENICATESCSIMRKLSRPNIDVCYSANGLESCANLWTSSKAWLLYKRQLKSEAFYRICNRQKKFFIMPPPPLLLYITSFSHFWKYPPPALTSSRRTCFYFCNELKQFVIVDYLNWWNI
jgi:hypothetical protein